MRAKRRKKKAAFIVIAGLLALAACKDDMEKFKTSLTSLVAAKNETPEVRVVRKPLAVADPSTVVWTQPKFTEPLKPAPDFRPMSMSTLPVHPFDMGEEGGPQPQKIDQPAAPVPQPYRNGLSRPMISIVIDDMGLDSQRSKWATTLPAAVTLSYLPYAPRIQQQVDAAKSQGHEVILHMPMEAASAAEDPGPFHLSTGMTAEQVLKNTDAALDAFKGYDGLNNHMGSKFTSTKPGLEVFMGELAKRNIFFLDSRTAASSIAEQVAREHHISATRRDVFIDHVETADFVAAALNHAMDVARATGSAVAIGHPKDVTLSSLTEWIPFARQHGFDLVPLATVVKYRNQAAPAAATATSSAPIPLAVNHK